MSEGIDIDTVIRDLRAAASDPLSLINDKTSSDILALIECSELLRAAQRSVPEVMQDLHHQLTVAPVVMSILWDLPDNELNLMRGLMILVEQSQQGGGGTRVTNKGVDRALEYVVRRRAEGASRPSGSDG